MTPTPPLIHRRAGLLLLALLMPLAPLRAEEPAPPQTSPREILRDALYAEEVTRDASKAAEHYEKVLDLYEAQQPFAATALFRLAEVRRKQGNKAEATKLYQRLLREFPGAEVEGKLARENLANLGAGEIPGPASVVVDQEAQELRRIQDMVKNTPDRAKDPKLASAAVAAGYGRVLEYLLDSGLETNPARLLPEAAESGHVKIVQMLIARTPKDSPEGQRALWSAVSEGYKQVAALLMDNGIKADSMGEEPKPVDDNTIDEKAFSRDQGKISLLHLALRRGHMDLVRLLLDHGADPNAFSEKRYPGSVLQEAVYKASDEAVKLLLSKGADPNLAEPNSGWTALHSAARGNRPASLAALLKAGAKLEARTKVGPPEPGKSSPTGGMTPLLAATESGYFEALEFLLKNGADPNAKSANGTPALGFAVRRYDSDLREKIVRLLLANKADPNVRFGQLKFTRAQGHQDPFFAGTESETLSDYSLLYAAAASSTGREDRSALPVMTLLLDAGCMAGAELSEVIRNIAPKDKEGKITRALAAQHRGPVNLEELPDMSSWQGAAKTAYLETVVYPSLAARGGASLVNVQGRIKPVELSAPAAAGGPPAASSLAKLLLSNPNFLRDSADPNSPISLGNLDKIALSLIRRGADGSLSRSPLDPNAEAPFPELLAGDIVELAPVYGPLVSGQRQDPYQALSWDLTKKVKFPATLEIDGETREITLRGDLLVYDPRHPNELPWVGAAKLISLQKSIEGDAEITVQRKGWPDIQVPEHPSGSNSDFLLEAGDKIVVKWKPYPDHALTPREKRVQLKAEGMKWGWSYPAGVGIEVPTLIQALADLDGRWSRYVQDAPGENEILPQWLKQRNLYPLTLFPYPDCSRIRILRLEKDGGEKIISVNLDPLIDAAAKGTLTAEQAREADVVLQSGDIVEIPSRKEKWDEAWKGWSEAEATFFAKALDCRIQFTDGGGVISLREVRYRAPRYLNWGASWIPVAPIAGTAALTVSPALARGTSTVELTRAGNTSKASSDDVFVREGDAVKIVQPQSQPNAAPPPPSVRPPRARGTSNPPSRVEEIR